MKKIKSHFQFSRQQRNGIFLLLIIITILQCLYFYIGNSFDSYKIEKELASNNQALTFFIAEVDSLKKIKLETNKSKIFPFNPNFITDYKGYALGMTNEEIDRLLKYRLKNEWINSAKEFQQVTKISDSVLSILSPYFKFPKYRKHNKAYVKYKKVDKKTVDEKMDLNTATASQLKKIKGVGDKLSQRIIKYRENQKGYISPIELEEIYGLSKEVIEEINNKFKVKTPKNIKKINLNTATREELVTIRYIDYDVAHNIIEERTLRGEYQSLDELTKVKDFPKEKYNIIKLYLQID